MATAVDAWRSAADAIGTADAANTAMEAMEADMDAQEAIDAVFHHPAYNSVRITRKFPAEASGNYCR